MQAGASDVLVVEDDKALNDVICRYVRLSGFRSRSALDGAAALQAAREAPPSLVLLDLMLPDMSGFDVCQELKRGQGTGQIPVVIVTGLGDDASRRRGLECGAVDYLLKPLLPDQLIDAIRKHAQQPAP